MKLRDMGKGKETEKYKVRQIEANDSIALARKE